MKAGIIERIEKEFGPPTAVRDKVTSWGIRAGLSVVVQTDQPNKENAAYLWLPYPADNGTMPGIALEYPAETGQHSGTYPAPGLQRGLPALKLIIRTDADLEDTIKYIRALKRNLPLPKVEATPPELTQPIPVDVAAMPKLDAQPTPVNVQPCRPWWN